MEKDLKSQGALVFSYLTLRKAIGWLGTLFPFGLSLGALAIFHTGVQNSISNYYHTGMRDVFVGVLFAIGFFLLSYRGYERKDDIAGDLACLFAVGTALFRTTPHRVETGGADWVGMIHFASAAALFLTLSYFSLFLFVKTDPKRKPSPEKLRRNRVYRACGYVMVASIALIALYILFLEDAAPGLRSLQPVFWLEAATVIAFGISWLTKGEAILSDGG